MPFKLPLYRNVPAPSGGVPEVFERLKALPCPFLLDTGMLVEGLGHHSFVGADPFLVLKTRGRQITVDEEGKTNSYTGEPMVELGRLLERFKMPAEAGRFSLNGGAVGYFSYDLGRSFEIIPALALDDLETPELCLGFYDVITAVDMRSGEVTVISTGLPERGNAAFTRAQKRLEEVSGLLGAPPAGSPPAVSGNQCKGIPLQQRIGDTPSTTDREHFYVKGTGIPIHRRDVSCLQMPPNSIPNNGKPAGLVSNFTPDAYREAVRRAVEYIYAGDIFEVNLSQRFSTPQIVDAWELYIRLRDINPAPMAAFLSYADLEIICASPERFIKLEGNRVETRPIKGTRPRGRTPEQDRLLRQELLESEKDRAELMMIVDLERNDLGRVCRVGSVRVPELFRLEEYATVFHLVSTVEGLLHPAKNVIDLLVASFPGGSITGAPKIRAMEIIEELEPVRRGIYTGSIGYIGFDGRADLNIVIRTILAARGKFYFQVGGAVTADSDPHQEYVETLDKARALVRALGLEKNEHGF